LLALVPFLVPVAANAQSNLGIMNRTDTSFTSRGSVTTPNVNPSQVLGRIDKEYYAGWGVDPLNPGMRAIRGLHFFIQDQIGNTPDNYGILVCTEGATPNFPDVTAPLATAGPFAIPPSTVTTAVAWEVTANFTTPVLAPATGDVFVGIDLPQPVVGGPWPADGPSVHAQYYVPVTSGGVVGLSDLPGSAHPTTPPEEVGNGCWYVPSLPAGPTYTITPRMWKVEPVVDGAAGVAGTITNQTTAPLSNLAPGTSSMGSGRHPDSRNPPLNAGRVDDVAGRWFKAGTTDGSLVFFLMDFGTFSGVEIPVSSLLAGSTGVLCLNPSSMVVVSIVPTLTGEAFQTITIPAGARLQIAGTSVMHQSAALNATTGGVDANGCSRQVF